MKAWDAWDASATSVSSGERDVSRFLWFALSGEMSGDGDEDEDLMMEGYAPGKDW